MLKILNIFLDYLLFSIVFLLVSFLRVLPQKISEKVSFFLVKFILFFVPRAKKVALRNIKVVFPEKSKEESLKILNDSYLNLAKNLVAFSKIPDLSFEEMNAKWDYSEWDKIKDRAYLNSSSKSIVFATMHFGLFEQIMQAASIVQGKRWAALFRGFGFFKLDSWWKSRREYWGCFMFDRKGGYQSMCKHLKEGTDVAVLFDQNVKKNHAVFVELFKIKAATTKSLVIAAERTGANIVFGVSAEYEPGKWKIIAREVPPELFKIEDRNKKIYEIMKTLHGFVEEVIREYPSQWFWIHRRFKTRPEGEKEDFYL